MRHERTVLWLLGLCVTVCTVVMLRIDTLPCERVRWCLGTLEWRILLLAGLAFPLIIALGRGMYSGFVQLHRTRQFIRRMRRLPHRRLTPAQIAVAQSLGVQKRLDVVITSAAHAWCYGLLRPRISVTTGFLDTLTSDELEAVLRHERYHLRRYDPLRTLLWTMCAAAGWGVEEQHRAHLHRELAADQEVIAAGQRQALASALLKLLTQQKSIQRDAAHLAISSISVTAARIDQLLQKQAPAQYEPTPLRHKWYVAPAAWSLILLVCLAFMRGGGFQ
jgi:Zn-dependent protease with chaperone function